MEWDTWSSWLTCQAFISCHLSCNNQWMIPTWIEFIRQLLVRTAALLIWITWYIYIVLYTNTTVHNFLLRNILVHHLRCQHTLFLRWSKAHNWVWIHTDLHMQSHYGSHTHNFHFLLRLTFHSNIVHSSTTHTQNYEKHGGCQSTIIEQVLDGCLKFYNGYNSTSAYSIAKQYRSTAQWVHHKFHHTVHSATALDSNIIFRIINDW